MQGLLLFSGSSIADSMLSVLLCSRGFLMLKDSVIIKIILGIDDVETQTYIRDW